MTIVEALGGEFWFCFYAYTHLVCIVVITVTNMMCAKDDIE